MSHFILFIHGAGASRCSFAFLAPELALPCAYLEHAPGESVAASIQRGCAMLDAIDSGLDIVLAGHSLGGLIAAGLSTHPRVHGLITMSAPLGGHAASGWMSLVSSEPLFRDLNPSGTTLGTIRKAWSQHKKPHLAIVTTTGGLPVGHEPNDGVISIASQTAWSGPEYERRALNHFEVLLSSEVADTIKHWIARTMDEGDVSPRA